MSDEFKHLLSPISVGPRRLRNRVLVTAHVPGVEKDGLVNDAYIAYQRARAHGGAGMQISGSTAVHRTGSVGAGRSLNNTRADIVDGYGRLAEAIHGEGGAFLIQIGHSAATGSDTDAGRPLWAPSPVASSIVREIPRQMSLGEIDEMVEAHAIAAGRVVAGGLDGVEILGAFGFMVAAFMSPLTNIREDEYGGSLENRLRFALRVIDAVREAAGPDRIVGLRLPGDERAEGGLTREDMLEIAPILAATGKLDYLNVIVGTNYDRLSRMEHWPPTPAAHGLFVDLAAGIKQRVKVPVFTTGRVTDPRMAEDIIRRGDADMIGMTRAHISDPDLVAKLESGRSDDIRPCVGANLCISQATEGKMLRCFHNPLAAREHEWGEAEPTTTPRQVVVIGGGPAGMEAARVAAERGHQVTLYEAGESLGGQLGLWSKAPLSREYGKTLTWFEGQLNRLQVRVHLNEPLTEEAIADLNADTVILATGSRPAPLVAIPGGDASSIEVKSPFDVLENAPKQGHVVLHDEGGGRTGLAAADALLEAGCRVTIVCSDFAIAELVNPNLRTPMYKRFLAKGAVFRPTERLVRLDGKTVVTANVYSGEEQRIEDVGMLVDWRGNRVVSNLQSAIEARDIPLSVIGDSHAPRQIHIAIAEGAMAARRI